MATHSSILAWRIPWTEEPGGLQSIGSQRVGQDWVTDTYLAFFMVQHSHLYMTTEETSALTIWTFVSKVMSLLFNMLSMLVIAFFPKSKHLLISWLQSISTVILEPRKIKSAIVSTVSPSITKWSILKSDWLYSLQSKMEKLYTVREKKTWSWLSLRSSAPYCKLQA